jgi:hypothetical protein
VYDIRICCVSGNNITDVIFAACGKDGIGMILPVIVLSPKLGLPLYGLVFKI